MAKYGVIIATTIFVLLVSLGGTDADADAGDPVLDYRGRPVRPFQEYVILLLGGLSSQHLVTHLNRGFCSKDAVISNDDTPLTVSTNDTVVRLIPANYEGGFEIEVSSYLKISPLIDRESASQKDCGDLAWNRRALEFENTDVVVARSANLSEPVPAGEGIKIDSSFLARNVYEMTFCGNECPPFNPSKCSVKCYKLGAFKDWVGMVNRVSLAQNSKDAILVFFAPRRDYEMAVANGRVLQPYSDEGFAVDI